jgi:hypothetical protein
MAGEAEEETQDTDMTTKQTPEDREKIIHDYGRFIELRPPLPTRIDDVSVLPYSKETILSALLLEIVRCDVIHTEILRIAARDLAQFQPGVGCEALEFHGVDIAKLPMPAREDIEGWRAYWRFVGEATDKTQSRFDQFNKLVEEDLVQINAQIEVAIALSEAMPEKQKKRVLD